MPRFQVGEKRPYGAMPWPVIDTHFGDEAVGVFRSLCLAREFARTLNEPYFRPPPQFVLAAGGER